MKNINHVEYDFVVCGGGIAGMCAALAAARHGLKVLLVNDRNVLGGNASSEIGVAMSGSCHGTHNPAIYAKDTGIANEINNTVFKMKEGGGLGKFAALDAAFFDLIYREKNITLMLNTLAYDAKVEDGRIKYVYLRHTISEEEYEVEAPFFADCTGNGAVGAAAGCEWKMGREGKDEFGEYWAPEAADKHTMGNSFYFEVENMGHEVTYKKPDFAYSIYGMDFVKEINDPKKFRGFSVWGPHWAYEYGGQKNIIKDADDVDLELRKLLYGIWDYVKNSGKYPNAKNASLKRMFARSGSRESRRFVGDYMLNENDIENKVDFPDSVAIGGWPMDIHAPLGIYDTLPASNFVPVTGTYNIPFRSLYSKNISNIFFAGRNISATHIALGSTRVMLTCGSLGQAVGTAAYVAKLRGAKTTREIYEKHIGEVQSVLLDDDQSILHRNHGALKNFTATASSTKKYENTAKDGEMPLERDYALMLPLESDKLESVDVYITAKEDTTLEYTILSGTHRETYIPDGIVSKKSLQLNGGTDGYVRIPVNEKVGADGKMYIVFHKNGSVSLGISNTRTMGAITARMHTDESHDGMNHDSAPLDKEKTGYIGIDHDGEINRNILFENIRPMQDIYAAKYAINGYSRPWGVPNLWLPESIPATINLHSDVKESAKFISVAFDDDLSYDNDRDLPKTLAKSFKIKIKASENEQVIEVFDNALRYRRFPIDISGNITDISVTLRETYGEIGGIYGIYLQK
ncbi:MAG: FAD-dependent oxidoreductase [Eubacteriales bacterium]|nr:FAD-dependent oxidoreductase [Eubacteriales bacterium]